MKVTTYIVEITTQKNEKLLSECRNHLLARLLAFCQQKYIPHEFTEKCFAISDQTISPIYLTWYRSFLFFREFSSNIPFRGILR